VVGEQERSSERVRCQDLRNRYLARVDARGDVQGLLPHLPYLPAARDRKSRAIRLAIRLVGDVVAGAEYVRHLVVAISHDRLLERNEVGLESAKAIDEHRPTLVPSTASPPQVERGDAHYDELVDFLRGKLLVLQTLLLSLQTFQSLRD
jgi:hypothetical protein